MAQALPACKDGFSAQEKLRMRKKKDGMGAMRVTIDIIFILFTYLYLDRFQADLLAVAQHILSGGVTTYHYIVSPLLLTLLFFLLQRGVASLFRVKRYFYALNCLPSLLLLTILTSVPASFGHHQVWTWRWLLVPLVLAVWGGVSWISTQMETLEPPVSHEGYLSRELWQNLLMLVLMMTAVVGLANHDRVFHERLKMERLMLQGRYAEALEVGRRSEKTDSSLTMLRIACMHRCGTMGQALFTYPLTGGSKAMIPDGITVRAMMWNTPRWMATASIADGNATKQTASGKRYRIPKDYKLCGLLLDRKLDRFVAEVKRTYANDSAKMPRHYKEALVLYAHRRTSPVMVYKDGTMEADFQDYQAMEHKYADPAEKQAALRETYGNTYWYYYQYGSKSAAK